MKKEYIKISHYKHSTSYVPSYPSHVTQDFLYTQRVGVTYCKPDYKVMNRSIESVLICYVFKGAGTLEYQDQKFNLKKGQLFVIDCRFPHSYYPDLIDPMSLLFLHFNGPLATKYTEKILSNNGSHFIHSNTTLFIRDTIGEIYKEHIKNGEVNYLSTTQHIFEILIRLLQLSSMNHTYSRLIPPQVTSAAKYIEQNFTQTITTSALSQQVSMSMYHFTRQFKRYIGFTPYEYVLNCRL
ncbi:MAG: helix-turn-helix transcriptional regulator, partial [Vallitaleaceae bacterium]|nr:helix-turn-helix transcriptional regulator [Vallitaleaceae bacterium]